MHWWIEKDHREIRVVTRGVVNKYIPLPVNGIVSETSVVKKGKVLYSMCKILKSLGICMLVAVLHAGLYTHVASAETQWQLISDIQMQQCQQGEQQYVPIPQNPQIHPEKIPLEDKLTAIEKFLYGQEQQGVSTTDRAMMIIKDLYGLEVTDKLDDKINQAYLYTKDKDSFDSFVTKLDAMEMSLMHDVSNGPVSACIGSMETLYKITPVGSLDDRLNNLLKVAGAFVYNHALVNKAVVKGNDVTGNNFIGYCNPQVPCVFDSIDYFVCTVKGNFEVKQQIVDGDGAIIATSKPININAPYAGYTYYYVYNWQVTFPWQALCYYQVYVNGQLTQQWAIPRKPQL